jgi:hypothetical protein
LGIFKKIVNKVLDTEIPFTAPTANSKTEMPNIQPRIGPVMYTEREIPDNSEEAKRVLAKQEKYKNETTEQRLNRFSKEERERMESAGLKLYEWSTCGDERVRPSHALMDRKLCRWSDPAVYSDDEGKTWKARPQGAPLVHPGEEEGCRCTALSYEKEIVGEIEVSEDIPVGDTAYQFLMRIKETYGIPGRGTVAVGEIEVGSIKQNEGVIVIGAGFSIDAKVISIERSNKLITEAKAGDKVEILLEKVPQDEVKVGYLIARA